MEKRELCVFTKFRVFPVSTSFDITVYIHRKKILYIFYGIKATEEQQEIIHVALYQHRSQPVSVQNLQNAILYIN